MTETDIKQKVDDVFENTELFSIPVEIVSVANYYGFQVFELEMPDNNSGMILVDENNIDSFDANKIIIVNANHSSVRKRFTVAHELGHYILQDKPSKCYAHRDLGEYSPDEKDANSFASALLMPEDDLRNYIASLGSFVANDIVTLVSQRYNVSASAAMVRLKKLEII